MTLLKAIKIAIELWEYIVERQGGDEYIKTRWPGWEKYGHMQAACPLCQYDTEEHLRFAKRERLGEDNGLISCSFCPLVLTLGSTCFDLGYNKWDGGHRPEGAIELLENLKAARDAVLQANR